MGGKEAPLVALNDGHGEGQAVVEKVKENSQILGGAKAGAPQMRAQEGVGEQYNQARGPKAAAAGGRGRDESALEANKISAEILAMISRSDSFKMFEDELPRMSEHFKVLQFADCEQVADPSIKDRFFVLVEGGVAILDDERIVKRAKTEVKRLRRKRKRA